MTGSVERPPIPTADRLAAEVNAGLDNIGDLIEANRAGFEATTDAQFTTRHGRQIGDQRGYASHLVDWADTRLRVIGVDQDPLPDIDSLSRQDLLSLVARKRLSLLTALREPTRWNTEYDIPWQGRISGRQLIGKFVQHEQRHEDYNRAILDKFDIDFPPEMVKIMGK